MAAGQAFLALAGPVGWGIGAVALVGGGLWYRSKNKAFAVEATQRRIEIELYGKERQAMALAIKKLIELTRIEIEGITNLLDSLEARKISNFLDFEAEDEFRFIAMMNHTRALGQLLKKLPEGATQS
jgi:hypothetical protein